MTDLRHIQNPLDKEFIRLLTDFGFKRVFGTKERKHILQRFLNALFEGRMVVKDIEYRDKEMLPEHITGKKVIYDIYCTTDENKHFIIEMQQEEVMNFTNRILFYACRAIVNQGMSGVAYDLDPVYCVVLTDFNLSGNDKCLVREVALRDNVGNNIYTDKMNLIFISLPEVPGEWDDCKTELERLLYLIKNMENLSKESKPYMTGEYDDLFTASATDNLSREEAVAYSQSYLKEIDNESAILFAEKRGEQKAIKDNVRNLRNYGLDDNTIAKMLNYSPEYIRAL